MHQLFQLFSPSFGHVLLNEKNYTCILDIRRLLSAHSDCRRVLNCYFCLSFHMSDPSIPFWYLPHSVFFLSSIHPSSYLHFCNSWHLKSQILKSCLEKSGKYSSFHPFVLLLCLWFHVVQWAYDSMLKQKLAVYAMKSRNVICRRFTSSLLWRVQKLLKRQESYCIKFRLIFRSFFSRSCFLVRLWRVSRKSRRLMPIQSVICLFLCTQ